MNLVRDTLEFILGDSRAEGIVPTVGFTALLVAVSAAATAFLAVFALCLGMAADRLSERWTGDFARAATVRVPGTTGSIEPRVRTVLEILRTTPGIASARALTQDEQRALLRPWLGDGVPLDSLPVPRLIEVEETSEGPDREGLRLRLDGEVAGTIYDDHAQWRAPLLRAASALTWVARISVALTLLLMAIMVMMAARAALSANERVVNTLRLIGAHDSFIIRAFVRRITLRAILGSLIGLAMALAVLALFPTTGGDDIYFTGLAPRGLGWAVLAAVPIVVGAAAFFSTRWASRYALSQTR